MALVYPSPEILQGTKTAACFLSLSLLLHASSSSLMFDASSCAIQSSRIAQKWKLLPSRTSKHGAACAWPNQPVCQLIAAQMQH